MTFDDIAQLLITYKDYAIVLSILINILISIIGVVPSWFLTAINIKLFGITGGFLVSYIGELSGTMVAFFLYRFGFQNRFKKNSSKFKYLQKLLSLEGKESFYAVLSLRLIPFIPSSLITLFAAFGKVTLKNFFLASLIGKIPVLILETYSVNQVLEFTLFGKILICIILAGIIIYFYKNRTKVFGNSN
ncbi:TVP38/TMEM64 family protein [Bacillus sp. EAC]|uniref:TVP38/TMEM64 family protein n=1 Tax=Bacillus sp. EAC TaxID=1978338 RepID=UPI000B43B2F8|nr:VTT domain-containing protein [Bacillus sp. EAC]